jgi:hypothetical protein
MSLLQESLSVLKKKFYKRNGEKIKQSCNNKETPEIGKENNSK